MAIYEQHRVDSPNHWLKQNMHLAFILICLPYRHWSLQSLFHMPTLASGTISLHANNVHLDIFWNPATHTCVSWDPDHISVCPLRSRCTPYIPLQLPLITYVFCGLGHISSCLPNSSNWVIKTRASHTQYLWNYFFSHLPTNVVYHSKKYIFFQARHRRITSDISLSFNLFIQ